MNSCFTNPNITATQTLTQSPISYSTAGLFTVITPNTYKYNLCKVNCHRIKQLYQRHKKEYANDMRRNTITMNLDITLTFQFQMSANKINHTYPT